MGTVWNSANNLFEDYLAFFRKIGIAAFDYETLNKFDQIHAGGIRATEKLAEKAGFTSGMSVLELGGGIGGVARFISAKYNVNVINLDLSWPYSITGKKLTELAVSPLAPVSFVNADALLCPFKDDSFDAVWLQHVNMNITDKNALIIEIRRVLKKGGAVIFHEWFMADSSKEQAEYPPEFKCGTPQLNIPPLLTPPPPAGGGWVGGAPHSELITYPLPWSDDEKYNHLTSFNGFIRLSEQCGFKLDFVEDESEISLKFYKKLLETKAFNNPIFKGRNPQNIFENTVAMLEKNVLKVYSGKLTLKT